MSVDYQNLEFHSADYLDLVGQVNRRTDFVQSAMKEGVTFNTNGVLSAYQEARALEGLIEMKKSFINQNFPIIFWNNINIEGMLWEGSKDSRHRDILGKLEAHVRGKESRYPESPTRDAFTFRFEHDGKIYVAGKRTLPIPKNTEESKEISKKLVEAFRKTYEDPEIEIMFPHELKLLSVPAETHS